MTLVPPDASDVKRCTVVTMKSPASMTSTNNSPGTISLRVIVTGSSPGGVMVNDVPTSNGPSTSIFSIPAFQAGHPAMSDQTCHTVVASADVSTLCSYSHTMLPP